MFLRFMTARELAFYGIHGKSNLSQGSRYVIHVLGKLYPNNPEAGWLVSDTVRKHVSRLNRTIGRINFT